MQIGSIVDDMEIPKTSRKRESLYPFKSLGIKQGFTVVVEEDEVPDKVAAKVRSAVGAFRKDHSNRKFAVRFTDTDQTVLAVIRTA